MTLHKDLTGADLHEPKGISTASSGNVYVANGSGSGSWQTLSIPSGAFTMTPALITSSSTWTKPTGCFMIRVYVTGGGTDGSGNGGTTSFGSYISATGGVASPAANGTVSNQDYRCDFPAKASSTTVYGQGATAKGGSGCKVLTSFTDTVTVTVGNVGTGSTAALGGAVFIEQYILA